MQLRQLSKRTVTLNKVAYYSQFVHGKFTKLCEFRDVKKFTERAQDKAKVIVKIQKLSQLSLAMSQNCIDYRVF
jgi:hypothetical protein